LDKGLWILAGLLVGTAYRAILPAVERHLEGDFSAMTLSPFLFTLFFGACLLGFLAPLLAHGVKPQLQPKLDKPTLIALALGLPVLIVAYLTLFLLKLDSAATVLFAGFGFLGFWLLSCFNLSAGLAGIPLLLGAVFMAGINPDSSQPSMPLIAYTLGLIVAKSFFPHRKLMDLLLPAIYCVGFYWIQLSSPQGLAASYQALLMLALSIALVLRGLQALPVMVAANIVVRAAFVTVVSGLLAWLGIQNLLLQPGLTHWAWLFAGGSLLGFLLGSEPDDVESGAFLKGAIPLVGVGIAALLASRLFGTVGWLVLAATVLSNPKANRIPSVVSLFFVGRVLLQGFIYQFNPNVTGINITHPYASAALYAGIAVMLILPGFLNVSTRTSEAGQTLSVRQLALSVLLALLTAGLSNYFLHAEATGSLLTALLIAGLSVSLLGRFSAAVSQAYPLLLSFLITAGCLLSHELLEAGNGAEKPEKLWVLGATLLVCLVLFALGLKSASRRDPVPVS
jgi:hypothetical protein